ncbi:MAG: YicC family protein [Paramuribaculum sp.]|nr:YicC family protein [Paramuribaculum sp.]
MILSMTGFGKFVAEADDKKISCEIKSLNSKQLDMAVRIPSSFRDKELEIRALIGRILERGKVDVNIFLETTKCDGAARFNTPLLESYKQRIVELSKTLGIPEPADWYSVLMRMPDILKSENSEEPKEADVTMLLTAVKNASEALMAHRRSEGERLEEFFTGRIERITELLAQVPAYEMERVNKIRTRIEENLNRLPAAEYDNSRLEQEMIYYIEKLDINEEKQRLTQHLRYFMETMAGAPGQGKKLGFIIQEMGREINTLGSKSNHAELQKLVVKMKDELEQIKEQVLNVM